MQCLEEQIKKHYKTLVRFGLSLTRSKSNAADLISESYIDIVERKKIVPCQDKDFLRWFYKYMQVVTMAKYGNYYKSIHSKEKVVESPLEIPDIEIGNEPEVLHSYRRFKESLDPLDTILFELIYEQKLTLKKICEKYQNGMNIQRLHILTKPLRIKVKRFVSNL